jgi:chromosome segregation ATPase
MLAKEEELQKKSKQLKQVRRDAKRLTESLKEQEEINCRNTRQLTANIEELKNELNSTRTTLAAQKAETLSLTEELSDVNQSRSDGEHYDDRDVASREHVEIEQNLSSLTQKYDEVQSLYEKAIQGIRDGKKEQSRLRQISLKQIGEIRALQDELNETKREAGKACDALREALEGEKEALKHRYDSMVEQLREQCDKQRFDMKKISESLREAGKLKATAARQKKLHETALHANIISCENECNLRLDGVQSKSDGDRKRLCAYVSQELKRFFNPYQEINEKALRNIVDQARDELDKLSSSDLAIRRMDHAPDYQTTEDAVARLFIKSL